MANDACDLLKTDLEAGTWTNYGSTPNIYIEDKDEHSGGNTYIKLSEGRRDPIQAFSGSVIYYERSLVLEIVAPNAIDRDNIYLDIIAIGNVTNRGYVFDRSDDLHENPELFRTIIEIKFIN